MPRGTPNHATKRKTLARVARPKASPAPIEVAESMVKVEPEIEARMRELAIAVSNVNTALDTIQARLEVVLTPYAVMSMPRADEYRGCALGEAINCQAQTLEFAASRIHQITNALAL